MNLNLSTHMMLALNRPAVGHFCRALVFCCIDIESRYETSMCFFFLYKYSWPVI